MITPRTAVAAVGMRVVEPSAEVADLIERHWIVGWDHRGRDPLVQETLPDPCVNLAVEPSGAWVYGVRTGRSPHELAGAGVVIGTKFRPGGFSGLAGSGPARALTDRTVTLPEAFGDDGEALERALEDAISVEAVVGAVEALVRRRRPPADPGRDLAMAAVEHMRSAPPRTSIAAVAAHAGLSPRALQRLFARHVGATPKQVLQRFRLQDAVDEVGRGEDSLARLARTWATSTRPTSCATSGQPSAARPRPTSSSEPPADRWSRGSAARRAGRAP